MTPTPDRSILVLGATGMLGHAMFRGLAGTTGCRVIGSTRTAAQHHRFSEPLRSRLVNNVDANNPDSLSKVLDDVRPDVVINCIGLVKQLPGANDPLSAIPVNALLPHRLARLCRPMGARLIHISTDCVFDGTKGNYVETDPPDATDLYGRSKLLGELDCPDAITLRTSIIGPELAGARGLVGWFLSQSGSVKGFRRAIFSGLPTVELTRVVRDFVLPDASLYGLYHVSAAPISKYDLLKIVADVYRCRIDLQPDDALVVDRSLDSSRFRNRTGYQPPAWHDLIRRMHEFG